ncbi:putative membrane-bound metal-dependent hydrolase (plasmid) [Nostoc sp. PCC 7524]|uniref:metal-dependent hydrolase n=1 Tax=Nostoc sp. (strain ATCC 29411 / PCC 7524) TaxID=28072 RepID=UPI00029EE907|nr:metal-dependent hydrolase [Nostoc sp. PCC 7524]AFY51364.1 putative membrane-bound metal-dependent hydrolase [Nostoc sp. PCC 7524]
MLGISHLLISGTATSLLLGTASPTVIAVGAIAGLLPDIDVSTSPAGRVLPWISSFFESKMPHRSCTHSLIASAVVAVVGYGIALFNPRLINLVHALNIGYTFGWFADVFTRGGVEMFWPSPVRCVCPGNRNLRLRTGSNAEYFVLVVLIAIALAIFNINNSGGILTQFNRLIASPSGVQRIYNESGSTHLIKANIKGVRTTDRSRVVGQFLIIQSLGTGFLIQSDDNKIYKASTEPDSQIFLEEITADVGKPAITNIEAIFLEDEPIGAALEKFNRAGAMVFISGQLSFDTLDGVTLPRDPYQFPYIRASDSTVTLEAAPLGIVQSKLGEEFGTGQLQVRIINTNSQ